MDAYKTPICFPYWPAELARQWHKWIVQEPWWSQLDALRYIRRAAWGDEPRPALPAGSWGRFFYWRWQCGGYGTKAFAWTAMSGAVDTEKRLGEGHCSLRQGIVYVEDAEDLERLVAWAVTPLHVVLGPGLGPRELFHRNTVRKLERLRLLDNPQVVNSPLGL